MRLLQLDRFIRQVSSDPRVHLFELLQDKLRKALSGDVISAAGGGYERITVGSFEADDTAGYGVAGDIMGRPGVDKVGYGTATPEKGGGSIGGGGGMGEGGEREGGDSPQQRRIAQQQKELLEQQAALDRQRQLLAKQQEERRKRLAEREAAKSSLVESSMLSSGSALGGRENGGVMGGAMGGEGDEFGQSERIREQQALLAQQEEMLEQLREQQALMQEQLHLDVNGSGFGAMGGAGAGGADASAAFENTYGDEYEMEAAPPAGLNSTLASLRKRGRVLIREYLVTLTPQQYEELQARRKELASKKSGKLPFAIHPYLKRKTGKPAYSTASRKPKYQRESTYESPYLNSNGPYIDSSWIDSYFRKDEPDKWVNPRGFERIINPNSRVRPPTKRGGLPIYDETY